MSKTLFEKKGFSIESFFKEDGKGLRLGFLTIELAEFYDPEDIRKIIRVLTDWLFDKKKEG